MITSVLIRNIKEQLNACVSPLLDQSNWERPPNSLTAKHQCLLRYPQLTCPTFQYERVQSAGLTGEQRQEYRLRRGKLCCITVCVLVSVRDSKEKRKGMIKESTLKYSFIWSKCLSAKYRYTCIYRNVGSIEVRLGHAFIYHISVIICPYVCK